MIMQEFVAAAKSMFKAPELSQDLDSMSATWRSKPLVWMMLSWCFLLGLGVLVILLVGTWRGAEDFITIIPLLLTGMWGYVVWCWIQALRSITRSIEQLSLRASADRVTIERQGLFLRREIELPLSAVRRTGSGRAKRWH